MIGWNLEFVDDLGEEKKDAINTAKDTFICLNYPRRCKRSTAQLSKSDKEIIGIGENREPRQGRKKRSEEVVEEACFENDEYLPPPLDEEKVCISMHFIIQCIYIHFYVSFLYQKYIFCVYR